MKRITYIFKLFINLINIDICYFWDIWQQIKCWTFTRKSQLRLDNGSLKKNTFWDRISEYFPLNFASIMNMVERTSVKIDYRMNSRNYLLGKLKRSLIYFLIYSCGNRFFYTNMSCIIAINNFLLSRLNHQRNINYLFKCCSKNWKFTFSVLT